MKSVIELVDLTKTYQLGEVEVNALRGVNLKIERGEFVAVMGASGSGKSTLMNMLGCLDRPTSGRYILEGEDVARLNESELATIRSRRIGFVFQNFNLLSRTSTLENVELPLFYSAWTADGEHRAADLVKLVGLAGREQSHPNQLSGGQQQRVAIARALVNRPSILLADEPTGNLDSTNSAEIMEVLTKLNREQGLTVIVVTHDPDVAAYADRIVTFRDGVIISDTRKDGVGARGSASVGAAAPGTEAVDRTASLVDEVRTFASMAVVAAGRAIKRNKLRAALTMLGIFIGVAAVITMVAVGDGARASVEAQINSLGTNLLIVVPGATTANGARAGLGSNSTLTIGDAQALARSGGAVALVTYMDRQVAQVVSGNRNWSTNIQGTTPSYFAIRDWPPSIGRIFTDAEEDGRASMPARTDGGEQSVRRGTESGRRDDPAEKLPDESNRRAVGQGTVELRAGPGRRGNRPVQHRRAQSAGRVGAVGSSRARGGRHGELDQPLRVGTDDQFGLQLDHRSEQRVWRRSENHRRG